MAAKGLRQRETHSLPGFRTVAVDNLGLWGVGISNAVLLAGYFVREVRLGVPA